jgi:hypothetical protein
VEILFSFVLIFIFSLRFGTLERATPIHLIHSIRLGLRFKLTITLTYTLTYHPSNAVRKPKLQTTTAIPTLASPFLQPLLPLVVFLPLHASLPQQRDVILPIGDGPLCLADDPPAAEQRQ